MPYVGYSPQTGWDVGIMGGVGWGLSGVGIGISANVGYSTQNSWSFGVGVFAGFGGMVGASASVNYGVKSGWSMYAGVGLNLYEGSGFSSNVTSAGFGWS